MSQLNSRKRAKLPNRAFAYVDSQGRRRLPINDESHVLRTLAARDGEPDDRANEVTR